jgi:predicted DNA binding CopG/RHH family protein
MVKLDRTNKKEKQVNFRIDEKSLTRVKKIALKKKISFSELIRLSVESYIKK